MLQKTLHSSKTSPKKIQQTRAKVNKSPCMSLHFVLFSSGVHDIKKKIRKGHVDF